MNWIKRWFAPSPATVTAPKLTTSELEVTYVGGDAEHFKDVVSVVAGSKYFHISRFNDYEVEEIYLPVDQVFEYRRKTNRKDKA